MKTPFSGAQTTLYCTLEDELSEESGLYYSDCAKQVPSKLARNVDDQRRLWSLSEKMVSDFLKKSE